MTGTRELRRRAELHLRGQPSKSDSNLTHGDSQRQLHELEVHQIELELQNSELQKTRNELEVTLEKYTDLYDFAPVGYFSVNEAGVILEANLTSSVILGVERSRLLNRPLIRLATPAGQVHCRAFLERVFRGAGKQVCETTMQKADGTTFWASLHGVPAMSLTGPSKWCRVTLSDITLRKRAEETQTHMEALSVANRQLRQEIVRRQAVEESLRDSERHYSTLLKQAHLMQDQLRRLSRQLLLAQEEERKRISRELHDEIAQTLTGINVRLASLTSAHLGNSKELQKKIAETRRMVEKSVHIVHQFARDLRPTVLDDLGLIPALHSFIKTFAKQSRLHIHLKVFAGVEQLDSARRTVLYRVAQEALTNVKRHAEASRVELLFEQRPRTVCLTIQDNGKSFEVPRVWDPKKNTRLGLLGMRERVEMVGGKLQIESTPGQGTTIHVEIPSSAKRGGGRGSR